MKYILIILIFCGLFANVTEAKKYSRKKFAGQYSLSAANINGEIIICKDKIVSRKLNSDNDVNFGWMKFKFNKQIVDVNFSDSTRFVGVAVDLNSITGTLTYVGNEFPGELTRLDPVINKIFHIKIQKLLHKRVFGCTVFFKNKYQKPKDYRIAIYHTSGGISQLKKVRKFDRVGFFSAKVPICDSSEVYVISKDFAKSGALPKSGATPVLTIDGINVISVDTKTYGYKL